MGIVFSCFNQETRAKFFPLMKTSALRAEVAINLIYEWLWQREGRYTAEMVQRML